MGRNRSPLLSRNFEKWIYSSRSLKIKLARSSNRPTFKARSADIPVTIIDFDDVNPISECIYIYVYKVESMKTQIEWKHPPPSVG